MAKVKADGLEGKSVRERAKIVGEKGFEVMLARLNGAPIEADQVILAMTASRLGMMADKNDQLGRQYRVSNALRAARLFASPDTYKHLGKMAPKIKGLLGPMEGD